MVCVVYRCFINIEPMANSAITCAEQSLSNMCVFLCRTNPSLLALRNARQHFRYLGAIFNSNIPNKKHTNVNDVALSRPQKDTCS